jgi:hypothetical protein
MVLWRLAQPEPPKPSPPPRSPIEAGSKAAPPYRHRSGAAEAERVGVVGAQVFFRVADRSTGSEVPTFQVLVESQASTDELVGGLAPLDGLVIEGGVGTAAATADIIGNRVWVVAPGYSAIGIDRLEAGVYELFADKAHQQVIRLRDSLGRPISGAVIALSSLSFDSRSASWSTVPRTDKGQVRPLGSACALYRGSVVFLSETDLVGDALFEGVPSGDYWIDYNRGSLPFVRAGSDNHYIVSVPSLPVAAQLVPLGAILVDSPGDKCVALVPEIQSRDQFPLYDSEDAPVVDVWRRRLASEWPDASFWVGPCSSIEGTMLKASVASMASGWTSIEVALQQADRARPVSVVLGSDPMKACRKCRFVVLDGNGHSVDFFADRALDLYRGRQGLSVAIGRDAWVPTGDYLLSWPGAPSGLLASNRISIASDGDIEIAVSPKWRCYSLTVSRGQVPVSYWGLSYRVGQQAFGRGVSGHSYDVWSEAAELKVTINHRGAPAQERILKWDQGLLVSSNVSRFPIAID